MQKFSQEKQKEIIEALEKKGAKLPCSRCGNNDFTLLNGYFNQTVQQDVKGLALGGITVPSVVVICNQCGLMNQHALGVLGFITPKESTTSEK